MTWRPELIRFTILVLGLGAGVRLVFMNLENDSSMEELYGVEVTLPEPSNAESLGAIASVALEMAITSGVEVVINYKPHDCQGGELVLKVLSEDVVYISYLMTMLMQKEVTLSN